MSTSESRQVRGARLRAVFAPEREGPARIGSIDPAELPEAPVRVRVRYSSLNYKDALAVTGRGSVVRRHPMVCGIDLAGAVEESADDGWHAGDVVIATGFGLGEEHWGGFCDGARLRPEWLVPMPEGRDALWAMSLGTAGLTAALCVMELEDAGLTPEQSSGHPVLVTGAGGGVGGVAVALLAVRGFRVAAVTGRPELADYLTQLGAGEVLDRPELDPGSGGLGHQRFSGGIDAVGGRPLAGLLRQVRYGGCVAACGLAAGVDLETSVFPFILRAVRLVGVDSVRAPLERRNEAWRLLSAGLDPGLLQTMTSVAPLERVFELSEELLAGHVRGRIVIELAGG